jgi:polysaccharide biosynthesis transport protein
MHLKSVADTDFVALRRFLGLVLRRWWLLAITISLAVAAAYVMTKRQAPIYQATTSLIVGESLQSIDLTARDIQISGQVALVYADMARRQPVLQATLDTLGLKMTWRELKSHVSVNVNEDIHLLEIIVEATSPQTAQAIANELARRLILLSPTALDNQEPDANQRFVQERLVTLRTRIQEGQARLEEMEADLVQTNSISRARSLEEEIRILEAFITGWESNYAQLLRLGDPERSASYLAVIEPAQAYPFPVRPNLYLNASIAALLGTALALGLLFALDYFDDTLKSADDLAGALNLTSLGTVGHIRGKNYPGKLLTRYDPLSQIAESYRIIRSNLQFVCVDGKYQSFMVTSALPGEGKSILTANLAIAMAQAGYRTIIVDSDLRKPVQHHIFQVSNRRGLTDLLWSADADVEAHLMETPVAGVRLLTSGGLPPNPSELLSSRRMAQIIARLNQLADIIVFDSTPALHVADTAVLSNRVDGVVLLVEAGQTHRTLAKQAIQNLERAGATVLGGVLNRVSTRDSRYPAWGNHRDFSRAVASAWQRLRLWS